MHSRIILALPVLLSGFAANAVAQETQSEFWPQIDAYINLDFQTRIYLLASFTHNQDTHDWRGNFGAHLDFALKPIFRRELRSRDDVFRKRYLSFRGGFRYISGLAGPPYVEHRWLVETTSRFLLPKTLLISDRSRGELRFISGEPFSLRYRNRLQLERDFSLGSFVFTPYVNDEVFYDTRYDAWNRNRFSIGVQIPAGSHLVVETFFMRQHDTRSSVPHLNIVSVKFNLYF